MIYNSGKPTALPRALGRGTALGVSLAALASFGALAPRALAQTTPGESERDVVVVTAERREIDISDAGYAVEALSGDRLETLGVNAGDEIAGLVPGVQLFAERGATSIFVRGIGNSASNPYADPNVGYNVDGVAMTLPSGSGGLMFDLARVEILKGPQGTLYGRNATAGVVNVISNDPTSQLEGSVSLTAGDYDLLQARAMINVPLSDTLSARLAFSSDRRDGYFSNGNADSEDTAARLKVLWKPSEALRVLFGADYSQQGGRGDQRTPIVTSTGDYYWPTVNGSGDAWTIENVYPSPAGGNTQVLPDNPSVSNENWGAWLQADFDLGFATLTALPAYREYHQNWNDANLGFGFEQIIDDASSSLEVRLASNGSEPLSWVVGGYALNEELPNYVRVQQSYPVIGSGEPTLYQVTEQPVSETESYAVFGQGTYALNDWLRLTAGARYTSDSKYEEGFTTNDVLPGVAYTFRNDWAVDSSQTTWRLGFDADIAAETLFYGNISTGYKAGGFGAGPTPNATPGLVVDPNLVPLLTYEPEEITAYDVGLRTSLLDGRLSLNAEAFFWDYKDQQIQTIFLFPLPALPPVIVPSVVNAGSGTAKGLDLSLEFEMTANDDLSISAGYLDTKYDSFTYPFIFLNNPVINDGRPFVNAPRWSGNVSYAHTWDLTDGGEIEFGLNSRVSAGYWVGYSYIPRAQEQDGYTRTDLHLSYAEPNGMYRVRAWVRNLEDADVRGTVGGAVPGTPTAPAPIGPDGQPLNWGTVYAPRTMGVTVDFEF